MLFGEKKHLFPEVNSKFPPNLNTRNCDVNAGTDQMIS